MPTAVEMTVFGNQKWIRLAMVMQLSVSSPHQMEKNSPGQRCTPMPSKVLVVGTSKTL